MNYCLCCTKGMPVTSLKICPLCGYAFRGVGWLGVDAHWKSHHEDVMSYGTFWKGICDQHRASGLETTSPSNSSVIATEHLDGNHTKALAQRSSRVENILTHAFIAAVAQELWKRDPWIDLQVFKADVDDSGFDLVLGCNGSMRYIQIKQTHLRGHALRYSLRHGFSKIAGGCAIVLIYDAMTLKIDHCLFYGGAPGEVMPPIGHHTLSHSPGRRTAEGVRRIRENYRDVPRKSFQGPLSISQLVDCLFPKAGNYRE